MQARRLRQLLSWYVPLLCAGIKVEQVDDDFRYAREALAEADAA